MKCFAVIILISMLTSTLSAQEYLPLQVGNSWSLVGSESNSIIPANNSAVTDSSRSQDTLFIQVVGDTLMPNGKIYARLNTELGLSKFIRSDSLSIYYYDDKTFTEIPVFNFNAEPRVQKEISFHGSDEKYFISLEDIRQDTVYGSLYPVLKFRANGNKEFTITFSEASGLCEYSEMKARSYEYKLASSVLSGDAFKFRANTASSRQEASSVDKLKEEYPAPFCPVSYIRFSLPQSSQVTITIYDILGNAVAIVANGYYPAGQYKASLRELNLPNGVYFFRLEAGELKRTGKMVFRK